MTSPVSSADRRARRDGAGRDRGPRAADRPARPAPAARLLVALLAPVLAAFATTGDLRAQQPATAGPPTAQGQLVDRVVAIVGDTTIALSEVQEEILRLRQRGLRIPQDPFAQDSLRRAVLDRLVQEAMLLERAKQMGVTVPEQRVEQLANDRFSRYRSRFRSDQALRKAVESTGQNMFQFRQSLRSRAWAELTKRRLRQQLVQQNELPPATVSEEEIRTFFQNNAAGRERPGSVTLDRVMVSARPDSAAADSARALAQQALDEIRSGTKFAVAARRYSDDMGTREEGGDLGWVRRDDVVPSFAAAAWAAPPGRAVGPVRSRLGFHVVKVENVRGGERRLRHILVRPRITDANVKEARERAEALADSLRAGADADRLARQHGLSGEQVLFEDVRLDQIRSRLGDAYAAALQSPSEGDVVGPIKVQGSFDIPLFAVLEIRDFSPSGEYKLEDVRERIRQQLLRRKQFQKYVEQLRNEMYVKLLI